MIKKQAKEILKYKDLTVKIQHMWDVKTKVIPLTVRPRTKSKSFRKYLSNILGKHKIKEVQKTSILDNAHILQNILMLKYKTFNLGNNISCTKYHKHRIVATPYTLEIWFASGIYLQIPCIKAITVDDDDDDRSTTD